MKKIVLFFLCIVLPVYLAIPTYAAPSSNVVSIKVTTLENGVVVTEEIIDISSARSSEKTYVRRATFAQDGEVMAIIAFTATYRFDGTSVSVVAKTVTQTDTYDGWSFTQKSFTSSGGTVTLTGNLSKWLIFNNSISMSMTCDKNGNVSYS